MADMPPITDEYAAELVAELERPYRSGVIGELVTADPKELLILKLYAEVQALKKSIAFLGGIQPMTRKD